MLKSPLLYSFSIFLFSISALFSPIFTSTSPCLDSRCSFAAKSDSYFQEFEKNMERRRKDEKDMEVSSSSGRRRNLSGLGSSPPRCTGKCGRCTPCKPVHVPVPPGTPVTAEYYPEAWRCKCGNRLYMP